MKFSELTKKTPEQIKERLIEASRDLQKLRFSVQGQQEKQVRKLRVARKLVAQLKTSLSQKSIESEESN